MRFRDAAPLEVLAAMLLVLWFVWRRAEARRRELAASREQFRQIVETTRAIPFEFALAEHRFTYVGPQAVKVSGYDVADWQERGFFKRVMGPDAYKHMLLDLAEQIARGGQYDHELRIRAKDGRQIWLRSTATVSGAVARGLAIDVTERKALEQELHQAQRLESVGRLASGVAHEINTPVQFASDSVTFVRDAWADVMGLLGEYRARGALHEREQAIDLEYLQANVGRSADRALEGLGRIAEIVKSMKAFAQADQVERADCDVRAGLEATLIIAKNEYKYVADVDAQLDEVPAVHGRAGELNQVWLALLTNAAQAISERGGRGKIRVRALARDGKVTVSISDTGCGIPESVRARVFEQFFTTRGEGKGRGLGLSQARAIVLGHGGGIGFDSKAGGGSTFWVTLPAAA